LTGFALSFTPRMTQITTDSGGNRLDDFEETTYGADGWITDPNRVDTDGDTWWDGYEINTKGTNPLNNDTDQDGARDNVDLDPKRNLLVAVKVGQIHHAGAWWDPKLAGIVWVNDAYTWVTEHRMGSADGTDDHTATFDLTYYADVPDDTSSVSVRGAGWGIVDGRWDDPLVDGTVGYTLQSGTAYHTIWGGNSWMAFDVWTHALEKTKTFLVTDGNATVTSAGGQHRLTGQDRYFVFAFDVTSAYAPFVVGVNTVVVPRSLFLDSKLRRTSGTARTRHSTARARSCMGRTSARPTSRRASPA
jgi:hypothetical protein